MRHFDYSKFDSILWDNEIISYLTQIHEHKGRQELFSRQKPVELAKLTDVAKVQSVESSNYASFVPNDLTAFAHF